MSLFKRGDVVLCALSGDYGKPRPAVIVQSDLFNATHASVTLCPITTHLLKTPLFRLPIKPNAQNGLKSVSQIMIDKLSTIPSEKIKDRIGNLSLKEMNGLNEALKLWLAV